MRRVRATEILAFIGLSTIALLAAVVSYRGVAAFPPFELRTFAALLAFALVFYVVVIAVYRLFLALRPLPSGDIPEGSAAQFTYHVYVLFFLMYFYPLIRSGVLPAPLARLLYIALGARLGDNTYSQGIIHDPIFVRIGRDSVVGQSALIIPHVIERSALAHFPVTIGNNVTIGANAIILAGVTIADGAIIAAGAVVPKETSIGRDEVWGGVPARRLRHGVTPVGESTSSERLAERS